MDEEPLFVEKYRPKILDETILSDTLRTTFNKFVSDKNIPNIILTGPAGVGKTTVAKALVKEIDSEYMVINGSLNAGIDTLRVTISDFASSFSFDGKRKYVILDEADYLSASNVMPALRNFMEEFSSNCGFILTCNYINRIIPPLQSRCSIIKFDDGANNELIGKFFKRLLFILKSENITYDKASVAKLLKLHYPDIRRVINELQRYSATGSINSGILSNFSDENFEQLIEFIKNKDFTSVRKWAAENKNIEPSILFRKFYDISENKITTASIAELTLKIREFWLSSETSIDPEINIVAFFTIIMTSNYIEFL